MRIALPRQPFVGPRPFETYDRGVFFGRKREAYEISSLVLASRVFILYAASGSGKTSLFNAGIRPLLEEELDILPTARFLPSAGREELNDVNVYSYAVLSGWASAEELESSRLARTTLADFLAGHPRRTAGPADLPLPRLLVFDQFEELFTTHPDRWQQRRLFLEQLAEASDADPDMRVLIIMREDFLARFLGIADTLFNGLKDRYYLEPLRQPAAEQAIAGPVGGTGRVFEPPAIDDLVLRLMTTRVDVGDQHIVQIQGEYVEPVLLQVVCQALWTALPADITTITLAHVRELADVDAALGRFYSACVRDASMLGAATESEIRSWVAQKLVTRPGGTRGTVYAGGNSIEGLPAEVVARLEGKLLRAEFRAGARWLEITHDSLLAPIEQSNAEFFRSLERPPGRSADQQMADQLAAVIGDQWQDEAMVRRLYDPYPLPVRWTAGDQTLATPWNQLVAIARFSPRSSADAARWPAGPGEMAGEEGDIADVLARIPTGRLVVLGEPGSGKTVLMIRLVLELLARRQSDDPVPVLLPVASWNPAEQDLWSWIGAQLATSYHMPSGPRVRGALGSPSVRSLLDTGLIMPILDGLDEIPAALRAVAIAGINDALRPGGRLVVTSRISAYREAARPARGPEVMVSGAAIIELQSPSPPDVAAYLRLSAGGPVSAARWTRVVQQLGIQSPLSRALTTPLMVSLVSLVYNARPGESAGARPDPAELLDEQVFPTPHDIESHLFDAFLDGAYRESPGSRRSQSLSASDARRWLIFLARYLDYRETTELAWWQLKDAAPRELAPLTAGVVCGITAGVAGLGVHPGIGFGAGILVGLVVVVVVLLQARFMAQRRLVSAGIAGGLIGGAAGGLTAGLSGLSAVQAASGAGGLPVAIAVGFGVGACSFFASGLAGGFVGGFTASILQDIGKGIAGSLVNGLAIALAVALFIRLHARSAPAIRLTWSKRTGILGGLAIGLAAALFTGFTDGPASGLTVGIALAITSTWPVGLVRAPTDLTTAPSPRVTLARDARTFWVVVLAAGIPAAIFGLADEALPSMIAAKASLGLSILTADRLLIAIASGLVVGLLFGFYHSASPSFLISRMWLALRKQLPWRLMRFLDDAHRRGVLRQVGAIYQFRHIELQRRLARAGQASEHRPGV